MFRTSSEDSLVGKCFVEFVALSLYMRMKRDLKKLLDKNKPVPHHSVKTSLLPTNSKSTEASNLQNNNQTNQFIFQKFH